MLGRLLDERYERGFDPRDRVAAVAAYRRAAVTGLRGDVQWAWQASREWATRAVGERDWAGAARATDFCLRAAAKLYAVQPAPSSQEFWLRATHDVPSDAADIYVRAGQPAKAVTALERGRARIGSAILAVTSADLDRLKRADNSLHSSFLSAADAWMHAIAAERREPPTPQLGEVTFRTDYTKVSKLFAGGRMARKPVLPTPVPTLSGTSRVPTSRKSNTANTISTASCTRSAAGLASAGCCARPAPATCAARPATRRCCIFRPVPPTVWPSLSSAASVSKRTGCANLAADRSRKGTRACGRRTTVVMPMPRLGRQHLTKSLAGSARGC